MDILMLFSFGFSYSETVYKPHKGNKNKPKDISSINSEIRKAIHLQSR